MKKIVSLLMLTLLAGCSAQREAPVPPNVMGMANPASVYCQQKGGKSVNIQTTQGSRSDCLLPGGERIDEWALYRRDHQ